MLARRGPAFSVCGEQTPSERKLRATGQRGTLMKDAETKVEKALRLMNQRKLNGLIIYSNGIISILYPSYLLYFSGFRPMGPRNAAILSRSGQVALLVDPPWDALRASGKTSPAS
jgi:hypothetical protein